MIILSTTCLSAQVKPSVITMGFYLSASHKQRCLKKSRKQGYKV